MGLWNIDAGLTNKQYIPNLKLVDGRTINTEVSTLYNDNQGGMWLGTLDRGILYYHPNRFRFQNIGNSLFPTAKDVNISVTCFTTDQKHISRHEERPVLLYSCRRQFNLILTGIIHYPLQCFTKR